jgi:nitrogen fixation protein NifU and related proteins
VTSDVASLYQGVILDHNRSPRNRRAIAGGRSAEGNNPLCGDRITVYVRVADGVIADASFEGVGCAIFTASASLMTESVKGRMVAEVDTMCERIHDLVTATPDAPSDEIGPLSALAGVRQFPVRARCAFLPWQALRAAVHGRDQMVSTE